MSIQTERRWCRLGAAALLCLAACAPLGGPGEGKSLRMERPEAPADYDVLVAQEFELEGRVDEAHAAYGRAHDKDPGSAFLLRKLSETSSRLNRLDEAVQYAEQALVLTPDDEELRLYLGTLHRFRRDSDAADRVLRDAAGDPIGVQAALVLYNVHSERGNLDEARAIAEWLVDRQPDSLGGVFALAQVLRRSGDPEGAEAALREALEYHEDDVAIYHQIAALRREQHDREGEVAIYREILRRHPEHRQTLARLAETLDELGRTEEVIEILGLLEREHDDLVATMRLGYFDLRAGRYDQAAARFERALAQDPRQHEISYLLGVVQRRRGQDDKAIAVFETIPPGNSRYVDARTQIAGIHERRGDYEEALRQVLEARNHQTARPLDLYIASLRAKSGDFAGAVRFLETLLAEAPGDPEVLYNLGVLYGEQGQQQQALAYMQDVLDHNPDHAGALNFIGYTWAEQGLRLDEAEQLVQRALEIRPDDGFITDSLGWIYYMRARPLIERGELAEGRALLERSLQQLHKAAELTGGDPVISEHLGDAYLLLEDKQRALENYEEALKLDPREHEQPDLLDKTESLRLELGTE